MQAKLFKGFTPYMQDPSAKRIDMRSLQDLNDFEAADPAPTQWSSIGFVPVTNAEFAIDVQGAGLLCIVQINERNLPGAVQKELIAKRMADLEARDGRKPGKKQYAEIREDVALELLPKAFIKRKLVPVLFRKDMMLIFSTSAKVCDTVHMQLNTAIIDMAGFTPTSFLVKNSISGALTTLAKEGTSFNHDDRITDEEDHGFNAASSCVLKGPEKQTIRVKDKDVNSHDVQELLKQNYQVAQIGLTFHNGSVTNEEAEFVMSEKFIFSGFKFVGLKDMGEKASDEVDTFINTAWTVATIADMIVKRASSVCGGLDFGQASEPAVDAVDVSDL